MSTITPEVVIVGAGPSGLAIAVCLSILSISYIILEKDECYAPLWKKFTYDRLKIHLAKKFCALPHFPFPIHFPTYISKNAFIEYLDLYVDNFKIQPQCSIEVEEASYDEAKNKWCIKALNKASHMIELFESNFLVIASGENSQGFIPNIPGMDTFPGEIIHSSLYHSGESFCGMNVLVVGAGNSGMEIAYDLSDHGVKTSISIRSQVHVMTKELIHLGMVLVKYLPVAFVDKLLVMLAKFKFGDLSAHGIVRPSLGPLALKATSGRSAVIDVGTIAKIKANEILVVKEPTKIESSKVEFSNGKASQFEAIIFATGYRSNAHTWLKDDHSFLTKDGLPREKYPNHWKGKNGLYCVGLARRGLQGINVDAQFVSNDIHLALNARRVVEKIKSEKAAKLKNKKN